ncbi:uroporphyrinogen-III synthase [Arthrobacter sp. A5]|uniref:uroporphyrinogen-III synthase n=1 Tax=Arthrobacter sp. A5 TaxID=576926 RepID=UPI003DA8746A
MSAGSALGGLRVAITRSPDRADALVHALQDQGAVPFLVPLIDFELAPDQDSLSGRLAALAAGEYDWLLVSSITTVRALKQWCAERGTELPALVPAGTRVATIGPTSRRVLEAEGLTVQLAPEDVQSAAGLVALWPAGAARVLLPHSNLADPALAAGMSRGGAAVDSVTAYVTVDYPARTEQRLTAVLASGQPGAAAPVNGLVNNGTACDGRASYRAPAPALTPAQAKVLISGGGLDAVVAASASAARSIARQLAPLPQRCLLVAIGEPTRDEAVRLGLAVAATAKKPTPAGIVEALVQAVKDAAATEPAVRASVTAAADPKESS